MNIVWILYHIHKCGDFLGSSGVFMIDNLHDDETTLVVFNTKAEERTNRNPAIEIDASSIENAPSRGGRAGGAAEDQGRLTVDMDTPALQLLESKNESNTEQRQRQTSLEPNDSKIGDNENNQVESSSRADGTMKENGSSSSIQDTKFQQISNFTLVMKITKCQHCASTKQPTNLLTCMSLQTWIQKVS
jgi:hypothetical protein